METLLALVAGHFLADYPLQGTYLATDKLSAFRTFSGTISLLAHAMIQGLVAATISGYYGFSPLLFGLGVGLTHFVIDLGKIRGLYGLDVDQGAHLVVIGGLLLSVTLLA